MKAIICNNYGSSEMFKYVEADMPSPGPNEVLVRNNASSVTAADIMMRKWKPLIGRLYLGIKRPKRPILGFEFAGEIVAVGKDVSLFKVGEKVCGGTTKLGCYAEYVCVNENEIITTMPWNIS